MNAILLGYVLLFAGSAVVCLLAIPRARQIQHPGTRHGFVGFLASVALWSGGYTGYLLAPTEVTKLAFYIIGFVFAFVAVGAWLYFCTAYTGRPPRQAPYRNLAIGVFLVFVALKITNPLHNLYFTTEWTTDPFEMLAIHHGLLYWLVLGLSYAVIAVGFFMLIERFYNTGADSRPLVGLLGLTALPAVVTILSGQIEAILPLMYEPPGVALFVIGLLFVYFERFEAIQLSGGADKPTIFLDADGRIRSYNQAAQAMFSGLEGSIGKHIKSLNTSLADHLSDPGIIAVSETDETRFYEVSSSPFMSGDVQTGQLVTITDVTDRESYRQRLEEKSEQLEALLRVVRHDIRNDMAGMLGWTEILQDHVTEEGEDALELVSKKSRHVVEITEVAQEFVDSLSDEGSMELEPIALHEVLEDELATVHESHPDATLSVSGELPQVSVEANKMLSSVFRNLFENAVKHNDEETPEITVSCEDQPETIRVRIADNGPGIPESRREEIFGKGEKGLESPGTGIGLYLVHTLTEQFGGDVWIEDNDPEGAVFIVELQKSA